MLTQEGGVQKLPGLQHMRSSMEACPVETAIDHFLQRHQWQGPWWDRLALKARKKTREAARPENTLLARMGHLRNSLLSTVGKEAQEDTGVLVKRGHA